MVAAESSGVSGTQNQLSVCIFYDGILCLPTKRKKEKNAKHIFSKRKKKLAFNPRFFFLLINDETARKEKKNNRKAKSVY